ncbi:MAG: MarR family transcriptional regulator [Chthonomonas sp.]|nr:MarR family transcriptional regulator [Chthonomonas sp.]
MEPTGQYSHFENQFIMEWGRMSSSWGINRTMAQIHALLLVTGRPHSMDEIIDRLGISRGNASMSLRDLMDWGVVNRFRQPGDRKDTYLADNDMWSMFAKVIRERKRREIDPTQTAIREMLAHLGETPAGEERDLVRSRFEGLIQIFEFIDIIYDNAFRTDEQLQEAISFIRQNAKG